MSYETRTRYQCRGDVRGCCGVDHKTLATAAKHLQLDQVGCRSQGGYSDRYVYEVEQHRGRRPGAMWTDGQATLVDRYEYETADWQ